MGGQRRHSGCVGMTADDDMVLVCGVASRRILKLLSQVTGRSLQASLHRGRSISRFFWVITPTGIVGASATRSRGC